MMRTTCVHNFIHKSISQDIFRNSETQPNHTLLQKLYKNLNKRQIVQDISVYKMTVMCV